MDLTGINIWSVILASLSTFVVGFVWYGKPLFAVSWQKMSGLSDEEMNNANMPLIFGLTYVLNLIVAFFLSIFSEVAQMFGAGALAAGSFAILICFGFVATSFGVNYLFARKPFKLYLIDAGYMLVSFFVMGLIIGAW
ncbi:MAG: DUF1761 domain-containing protein [Cyclobacteriaceae bacterium]|nr:DUF1761 domain-containing protein [Cyclobacteriaceae bacterium]